MTDIIYQEHSTAVRFTKLTTQSAFCVSRLRVRRELYGWTTTSEISSWLGKTEYVWISFFGNLKQTKAVKRSEVRFRLHIDHSLDSCFSYLSTVIRFPQWIGF